MNTTKPQCFNSNILFSASVKTQVSILLSFSTVYIPQKGYVFSEAWCTYLENIFLPIFYSSILENTLIFVPNTFFDIFSFQWRAVAFSKKGAKKIYPKRAIGLNLFTKNTGGNYFFTMAEINAETYFECSQTQKMQKKIDVGPRIH